MDTTFLQRPFFRLLMFFSTDSKPASMLSYVSMHTDWMFFGWKKSRTSGFLEEFFSCKNALMLKNTVKRSKPSFLDFFDKKWENANAKNAEKLTFLT
ncbi:unnamed protein product [Staurois parvus]|uniref:Secreted protein n=1 Tax=Staurois parvus TaxID=386267 RepID=A0ABN9EYQ8_9NEOB|nr:unnamed protein product [Staurois parvus]